MNPAQYVEWLYRAFAYAEGSLSQRVIRPNQYMSEEHLRAAFVDGLTVAIPAESHRISCEENSPWAAAAVCWQDASHGTAGGRKLQHDVWIAASAVDGGAACEVKWLKTANPKTIAHDVLKLALVRSTTPEMAARRTFLLVGGEKTAFDDTVSTLRSYKIPLCSSPRGPKGKRLPTRSGRLPEPQDFSLLAFLNLQWGRERLLELLGWGKAPNRHQRTPAPCRTSFKLVTRAVWRHKNDFRTWILVLWELQARGAGADEVEWATAKPDTPSC